MLAVGKIGRYISRGVYTVSGPFQPFGGAVDIVVVEQPDGTFMSSPWYVRFGKYQGGLKASERVVSVNVNGVDTDFNMLLDHKGDAFFLREVDAVEGELESYVSSGDEMDVQADIRRHQKSKSCNFDADHSNFVSELEPSNGKTVPPNNTRRRFLGLPFGRRSMKENGFQDKERGPEVDRVTSLERAEIAADLLEVRWSTNLRVGSVQLSPMKSSVPEAVSKFIVENGLKTKDSFEAGDRKHEVNSPVANVNVDKNVANPVDVVEIFTLEETQMRVGVPADISSNSIRTDDANIAEEKSSQSGSCRVSQFSSKLPQPAEDHGSKGSASYAEELISSMSGKQGDSCKGVKKKIDVESTKNEEVDKSLLTSSAEEFSGDSVGERNANLHMDRSEDDLFSFSDLDDLKVDNDESLEVTSLGGKDSHSQEFAESSEDELADKGDFDDQSYHSMGNSVPCGLLINDSCPVVNSNSVSSPIRISKLHKDTDGQAMMVGVESLPNNLCNDGDLNPYGMTQLLGRSLDSNLETLKLVNDVLVASEFNAVHGQVERVPLNTEGFHFTEEIRKILSDPAVELSLCRHLLYEGMGYEAAGLVFDAAKLQLDNFFSVGPEIVKDAKLVVRIGGLYFPWDAALPVASAICSQGREQVLEPNGMIAVGQVDNRSADGPTQKTMDPGGVSWKMWPFSFKRSNSAQDKILDSENASKLPASKVESTVEVGTKASKKKIRAKAPTSEQLASMNLKEGKNEVTFTFSTRTLEKQQVDARIFLWKWNTRIVISDVDGTITKSDVLGQFMPLMGVDWSQTGVTHLFSAIKKNGYQILFLSARSISQAYQTRQFLLNLKQDGKDLPEGPVIISPDGLFPSLYREVIRRAPHEFKISCLEDIKVLFPPDHNPFYAGFGNRDTDEVSYLKVGIPIGKIFIINPKGQIAVNRRVDKKSYSNLHALVHEMFPPAPPAEQEDYNSWNFWRVPPPDVF